MNATAKRNRKNAVTSDSSESARHDPEAFSSFLLGDPVFKHKDTSNFIKERNGAHKLRIKDSG